MGLGIFSENGLDNKMEKKLDLSVVIVNFNTKELLGNCLDSIARYTKGINYEIIIVDNASSDGSVDEIKKRRLRVKGLKTIFNKENLGFATANNQGIKLSQGQYILLLNSDTKLHENSLSKMIEWMDAHLKVGISSCMLLNPDKSIQETGGYFPNLLRIFLWASFLDDLPLVPGIFGSYHPHGSLYKKEKELDWVTGAFFLVRDEVIKDIGLLDDKFFMYVEEVDYCYRVKSRGWEIRYVPNTSIVHLGGGSSSGESVQFRRWSTGKERSIIGEFEGLKRFYKKHYPVWQYPFLIFFLKLAALLRLGVFGFLRRQAYARTIYAKAFANI